MILGNFIIFIIVIAIVCVIDLSTLTLDSDTEKLLYAECEDGISSNSGKNESDSSSENSDSKSKNESSKVSKKATKKAKRAGKKDKITDDSVNNANNKSSDDNVVTVDTDDIGMSDNFMSDDFSEADNMIMSIYEEGGEFKDE